MSVIALQQAMIAGPGATDPSFSSVTSLIHFDGTDGATTFPDVKGFNWTPDSTIGNIIISTAQSKFGGSSLFITSGGGNLRASSSGKFDFGSGAFTIECWVRPTAGFFGAYPNIFSTRGGGSGITIRIDASGFLEFFWGDGNNVINTSTAVSTSIFSHVALTRSGNTIRLFLNGVLLGSTTVSGSLTTGASSFGYIGTDGGASSSENYRGYIDDFRVTKGVARYTAGFTPPTSAFPNS